MKIISAILTAVSVFINLPAGAQDNNAVPGQFLFPEFQTGVVQMKNGERAKLRINYNIVTEKMVFMQEGKIYDIINYPSIDTVYINARKFFPSGRIFFELLEKGRAVLFIQHKGKLKNPSRPAAYGGTSEVSSSTYIDNMMIAGETYRSKRNAEVVIIPDPILWIKYGDRTEPVTGVTRLKKLLSDRRQEVNNYLNGKKLDVTDTEQMIGLVGFYNSL
jgi:hypothetical protein